MVIVTANQYDGGSDGSDGNLTQQTQYVSATSGDTRATNYGYDFRDRQTSMRETQGQSPQVDSERVLSWPISTKIRDRLKRS
jgi:hypothetical protein